MGAMRWAEFATSAPDLAAIGRERFTKRNVMVLATIRADGSPRISAVNPFYVGPELLVGSMRSAKVGDLIRDPRCAVHSAIVDGDGSEGEFKLFARAIEITDRELRNADPTALWTKYAAEKAWVFAIDIAAAVYVKWDWDAGTYEVNSWSVSEGLRFEARSYP